jgi:hypothetical protein
MAVSPACPPINERAAHLHNNSDVVINTRGSPSARQVITCDEDSALEDYARELSVVNHKSS